MLIDDEFQDKLMFGTDSCKRSDVNLVWRTVALVRELRQTKKLPEDTLAKIEWRNCANLLGLAARE
jgi:hypothetical protein